MIKKCEVCDSEFKIKPKHGGSNRSLCYDCLPLGLNKNERTEARRVAYRKKASREKLEIGCSECGYNKNSSALEWHHHNVHKEEEAYYFLRRSWKAYKEETARCVLLCSNCHRELHHPDPM